MDRERPETAAGELCQQDVQVARVEQAAAEGVEGQEAMTEGEFWRALLLWSVLVGFVGLLVGAVGYALVV